MNEQQLLAHIASTVGITPAAIFNLLDHDEDYPNLPTYLFNNKLFTTMKQAELFIRDAKQASMVRSYLGGNPTSTGELVMMFTDAHAFRLDATQRDPMTWTFGSKASRVLFDEGKLVSELLNLNRNLLKNKFRKGDVEDEVTYFVEQKKDELARLMRDALSDPTLAATITDQHWDELVSTVFSNESISFDLTKRILQEFIYQVKRRLFGLPVRHHLMPVIYGGQGTGKSEFVNRLVGVLGNLYAVSNFAEIADNRNATLFQNFVIVMDEMGKADRSDIETVKSAITRDFFTYRPMGSNADRHLKQNALFIGSSNKTLGEIIKDPTGNRRFAQLDMKRDSGQTEWDYVNKLDIAALWSSVDHTGKRPLDGYEDALRAAQTTHHNLSSVGLFLTYVRENNGYYRANSFGSPEDRFVGTDSKSKEELHDIYRAHCSATHAKFPLEVQAFIQEMNRELGGGCPFEKKKSGTMKWLLTQEMKDAAQEKANGSRETQFVKMVKSC